MAKVLPHDISGNKNSTKLLVFLHGYPDTNAVWENILPDLEKEAYVLRVSYPNFSQQETTKKGLTLEELADRIKATIDHVNDTKRKVVMVSHDWGCMFGYYVDYRHPGTVTEMIPMDVGAKFNYFVRFLVYYQVMLAIAWIIGGFIGNFITNYFVNLFMYKPAWRYRIDHTWNWAYYDLWKKILLHGFNTDKAILPGYEPSCNVTYVYATKFKRFQFSNKQWEDMIARNPKSEAIAVDCSHWIHKAKPEWTVDLIKSKLARV